MMIFFAVALAHFIALISPGPDFLLIIKSTLRNSRRVAFGVVSGIATANALYIVLCLAGAGAILAQSVTLMILIKLFGGIFLLFIAWQALRAKKSDYRFLIAISGRLILRPVKSQEFIILFKSVYCCAGKSG